MSTLETAKQDYSLAAPTYNTYSTTPIGKLETQLIRHALGDLINLTVLDLGGGTGLHARDAIDLGAAAIDIVDLSPEMLQVALDVEKSLGREGVVRVFEGDVSRSLDHLPLREEGYDVVMANWVLNYADSVESLQGMLENIVRYLKKGGLFVGVREADAYNPVCRPEKGGKYGLTYTEQVKFPGGVKFKARLHGELVMDVEGWVLDLLGGPGPLRVYEEAGLAEVEIVRYDSAAVVQDDEEYWSEFLEEPSIAVVKGIKV